jgi:hypothetical protein
MPNAFCYVKGTDKKVLISGKVKEVEKENDDNEQ